MTSDPRLLRLFLSLSRFQLLPRRQRLLRPLRKTLPRLLLRQTPLNLALQAFAIWLECVVGLERLYAQLPTCFPRILAAVRRHGTVHGGVIVLTRHRQTLCGE